jgi:hypothetical protein
MEDWIENPEAFGKRMEYIRRKETKVGMEEEFEEN